MLPIRKSLTWHLGILCFIFADLCAQPVWTNQYDKVRSSDGVFIVSKANKMAVVNPNGKLITQFVYDTIYNFSEGMAIVGRGHREVNQFGKVLSDFKYGYITKAGRLVVPVKYDYVEPYSEGVGYVMASLREDLWFDKQGKIALSLSLLTHAESFRGNIAYVYFPKIGFHLPPDYAGQQNPFDIRGNYIDHQGRLLVPWKYDTIAYYKKGYLRPVRKNGKWGFLDSMARVTVPLLYDDIDIDSAFFWQHRRRVMQGGKFGFIDSQTGQLLIPAQFEDTRPSQSAHVWVKKHRRWGSLNTQNRFAIPPQFDDIQPYDELNRSIVNQNDKWGLINNKGRVLAQCQYDKILPFQENIAIVKRADKFGFIDIDGREIIPAHYDEVSQFMKGHAFAKRWGLFLTLDTSGNWVAIKLQPQTLTWLIIAIAAITGMYLFRRRVYLLFLKKEF